MKVLTSHTAQALKCSRYWSTAIKNVLVLLRYFFISTFHIKCPNSTNFRSSMSSPFPSLRSLSVCVSCGLDKCMRIHRSAIYRARARVRALKSAWWGHEAWFQIVFSCANQIALYLSLPRPLFRSLVVYIAYTFSLFCTMNYLMNNFIN